jgi:hypothetical protein
MGLFHVLKIFSLTASKGRSVHKLANSRQKNDNMKRTRPATPNIDPDESFATVTPDLPPTYIGESDSGQALTSSPEP